MELNIFGGFYQGKRVLVTGHTGFKGSWLVLWLRTLGAEVAGLALDPDTSPAHWSLLGLDGLVDCRVDLRDKEAVGAVVKSFQPDMIFHLAAQPLVRRSYRDPESTFSTNILGLVNLLEVVRDCPSVRVLINATTDKVYAEHTIPSGYCEGDPLGGHDPYSSSKACAELLTDCYRKSFFDGDTTRLATVRAGNVIGGGDWAEDRLVPDLVRAASTKKALFIRNPAAIRPWQHVLEPLSGYLRLGQLLWNDASLAKSWNFGPGRGGEIPVQSLTERLASHWDALQICHDVNPQPHESDTLRLNACAAQLQLGWMPVWDIDESALRTSSWYRAFYEQRYVRSLQDLNAYVQSAQDLGLEWAR